VIKRPVIFFFLYTLNFDIGVSEPDFHVIIDIATKQIQLISPNLDPAHVMWMGLPDSLDTLMAKYDIDEAIYVDQLNARLASASIVYTLPIANTSKVGTGVKLCSADQSKQLHTAFADARAIKSDWEVEIIRQANKISSDAHVKVKARTSIKQT
jgi:Xaa-Pro dipeptidase